MPRKQPELHDQGDSALAALARSGNTEAYGILWRRHAAAGGAAARQFASIADPDDLVSEAFARILGALQRGGGPNEAFRPYLYRTIRNVALDWRDKTGAVSLEVTPELEDVDSDPEIVTLERSVTARAFRSLPERWQAVLWYLEVEGMDPAEIAPLLQLSSNAVSALALRAREGLKKAWLQAHVNDNAVPEGCRWTTERMGQYARGGLSPRGRSRFAEHLESCDRCPILLAEVEQLSGSLASVLIPVSLGGAAGAGLLSQRRSAQTNQAAGSASGTGSALAARGMSLPRAALVGGAGILAAAVIATGAFAVTTSWRADPTTVATEGSPQSVPTVDPTPDRWPTPASTPTPTSPSPSVPEQPREPDPPAPPDAPPVTPPVTPPDITAPGVPVLVAPADGMLTNNPRPGFGGSGEPGARVDVRRTDASTGEIVTVASAVVDSAGGWAAVPADPLPDGQIDLVISQVDAAGNRSVADQRSIVVDTIALAPQLDALPAQPMILLPDITGSAEAGAQVSLRDDLGTLLGTVVAGTDGRWTISLPDPTRDGSTVSAAQTDPAGNVSPWSDASSPLSFDRPSIPSPASGSTVPSTGGSTVVQIELAGHEGMQVEVFVDGVGTGNRHTLQSTPIVRVTAPLSDGSHTIGVRYVDGTGVGSVNTIDFVIG